MEKNRVNSRKRKEEPLKKGLSEGLRVDCSPRRAG